MIELTARELRYAAWYLRQLEGQVGTEYGDKEMIRHLLTKLEMVADVIKHGKFEELILSDSDSRIVP